MHKKKEYHWTEDLVMHHLRQQSAKSDMYWKVVVGRECKLLCCWKMKEDVQRIGLLRH